MNLPAILLSLMVFATHIMLLHFCSDQMLVNPKSKIDFVMGVYTITVLSLSILTVAVEVL